VVKKTRKGKTAVPSFYEFFAGGGMARAGLGPHWSCLFANDIDPKKGTSYAVNWGAGELQIGDVADITPADLPAGADLAWASFPCQDLSLAGDGAGLQGERSGTFWPFWKLIKALAAEGRAPRVIVLENVCGALTSHDGRDFAAIGAALAGAEYCFGALVINAVHFLPQSRPRLFIVAVREDGPAPLDVVGIEPAAPWHTGALVEAYGKLSKRSRDAWAWWRLPAPPQRRLAFVDLIEDEPKGVNWHTREETKRLLGMMSRINLAKVEAAKKMGRRMVGGVYKRTRRDEQGRKVQRAEIRFDDVAGCLRTPVGGSSRQTIMMVDGKTVRSRLLSPREAARLMGLPDYILPDNYNEAYHLVGDGLAVPVVRFLAENLLEPILAASTATEKAAA
jgi:DNA (cytosine-5)-methyltransferase 1